MSNAPTLKDPVAVLRRSRLMQSLPEAGLKAVSAAMRPRAFDPGRLLIKQGEPGGCFYLIASGLVEVQVRTEGGTTAVVATLREGDCLGEMSLLSGDVTSADARALERTETLALEAGAFDALLQAHPELLREFVRILSRRLGATDVAVGLAREDEKALAQLLREGKADQYGELIGKHATMTALNREIDKHASSDDPLLVLGERGTGKEIVARLAHLRGPRKDAPIVSVQCDQISETPWGDKLFGLHHKGAGTPRSRGVCYMTLAEGGTLVLKDVELLPVPIQERLAEFIEKNPGAKAGLRFIATSRARLVELAQTGKVSESLARAFAGGAIVVPPLRDRKRDIGELARHFVRRHAERLNKPVQGLSDQAMTKLVSHDYRGANIQELKEALERAVVLTDDKTVGAEEIFLGHPAKARRHIFNFLSLKTALVRRALVVVPRMVRPLSAVFFAFILYQCFAGTPRDGGNLGVVLVWAVWWPALALSFFVVGRLWCAVCPMALAGSGAQRVRGLKWRIPAWLKDHDTYLALAGFTGIIWLEEATGMRHAPVATGLFLLSILAGAATASVLFPRRTWCRHLCPLGFFAGLCSESAMLELRPTADICSAKCTGHACYKGDERVAGCPVFNHVMFMDSNQHCVLCMNCVQTCPNDSVQLNLRLPASELWSRPNVEKGAARFFAVLLGLLPCLAFIQHWDATLQAGWAWLLAGHRTASLTIILGLGVAAPLALLELIVRPLHDPEDPLPAERVWRKVLAWGPLVTAGFACYQLAYLPGMGNLRLALGFLPLEGGGVRSLWLPVLGLSRVAIMAAGLMTSAAVMWKLAHDAKGSGGKRRLWGHLLNLACATAYAAALTLLMVRPRWLGL
ncbi:MAG: sigma 54-interacting transcriptional regulator [Elusimicrobia bacterium]|nr:sigma 54-interacting transcriptional regulator [Elusimicrobiota bacterium]